LKTRRIISLIMLISVILVIAGSLTGCKSIDDIKKLYDIESPYIVEKDMNLYLVLPNGENQYVGYLSDHSGWDSDLSQPKYADLLRQALKSEDRDYYALLEDEFYKNFESVTAQEPRIVELLDAATASPFYNGELGYGLKREWFFEWFTLGDGTDVMVRFELGDTSELLVRFQTTDGFVDLFVDSTEVRVDDKFFSLLTPVLDELIEVVAEYDVVE